MSFKRKVKRFIKRTIGDFTGVQWRDLDHKKVYIAIAGLAAVLILVLVLVIGAIFGGSIRPLSSLCTMISPPIILVETPQDV